MALQTYSSGTCNTTLAYHQRILLCLDSEEVFEKLQGLSIVDHCLLYAVCRLWQSGARTRLGYWINWLLLAVFRRWIRRYLLVHCLFWATNSCKAKSIGLRVFRVNFAAEGVLLRSNYRRRRWYASLINQYFLINALQSPNRIHKKSSQRPVNDC